MQPRSTDARARSRCIVSSLTGTCVLCSSGALLAKSAGEGRLATQLLHMYLGGIGWPERIGATDKMGITALSFLSTLQFEAGQVRPKMNSLFLRMDRFKDAECANVQELLCIRTLRTVTRLQLEPSPHHWSMLSTVLLRSGPPQV